MLNYELRKLGVILKIISQNNTINLRLISTVTKNAIATTTLIAAT